MKEKIDYKILPISKEDFISASKMIRRTIKMSWSDIYPVELLNEFCKKYTVSKLKERAEKFSLWVAKRNNTILGIVGLKENELRTFFVDTNYQGQGVGRALYEVFEKEVIKRNIRKIKLEGSPKGEPVYKKFGFKKQKTIYKERVGIKYSDAVMSKTITH